MAPLQTAFVVEEVYAHLDHALDYIRVPQLYGQPPRFTQFDQAATGGIHGEGMIVAVIDTGSDWTHPMFGGDPTPPRSELDQQWLIVTRRSSIT